FADRLRASVHGVHFDRAVPHGQGGAPGTGRAGRTSWARSGGRRAARGLRGRRRMEAYLILKVLWWLLLGVLLMGLAVMVGMDMGVGTILRYVGRSDVERRVALNIVGPHWDGNQVWFVLGGGAIFAAWPLVYATAFSGFYVVMLLLLWSMIVRPLGFEYRSKL